MVRRDERHYVASLSLGRKGTVRAFEESLKVRVVLTSQSFQRPYEPIVVSLVEHPACIHGFYACVVRN